VRTKTFIVVLIASLGVTSVSFGQPPSFQPYQPAGGPVLSPNLQFFRRDPGPLGLGQYLSFVQPRVQLRQALGQQYGELNLLQGEIRRIGEQEVIQPTGVGGAFGSERAYFQNQNAFFGTRTSLPRR
jgi:hypothetical protein